MGLIKKQSKSGPGEAFTGFKWFIGVAFLLCEGDAERCNSLLSRISSNPVSAYLWPSTGIPEGEYDASAALLHVGHHVEMVLAEDVGLVYSALRCDYNT